VLRSAYTATVWDARHLTTQLDELAIHASARSQALTAHPAMLARAQLADASALDLITEAAQSASRRHTIDDPGRICRVSDSQAQVGVSSKC
jgi:hypothetical protein